MGEIKRTKDWTWDYDEEYDILNVHKANAKVRGGEEVGDDITLDLDNDDIIVGFEIMHAHEFLSKDGLSAKDLEHIDDARFEVEGEVIWFFVRSGRKERKILVPTKLVVAS